MFGLKSSRLKLIRSSSMRAIPEGSEEEQKIRTDWNLRRTLSDFINSTYAPSRYKVKSGILSSSQICPATDEEDEATDDDDTDVEDEGLDLVAPKRIDTGIRIVGYLLKDGTYINCREDFDNTRPSLTPINDISLPEETDNPILPPSLFPITNIPFSEETQSLPTYMSDISYLEEIVKPTAASILSPIKEMTISGEVNSSSTCLNDISISEETVKPTVKLSLSPNTELTHSGEVRPTRPPTPLDTSIAESVPSYGVKCAYKDQEDIDKSTGKIHTNSNNDRNSLYNNNSNHNAQCIGNRINAQNAKMLENESIGNNDGNKDPMNQSLRKPNNLTLIKVLEKENDVFQSSHKEKFHEDPCKVKDRIAKIEKKLSDSTSPDLTEIDFDQLFFRRRTYEHK